MLAHLQIRCVLHSARLIHTRTLRTAPRRVPPYIKSWNPTLHEPTWTCDEPNIQTTVDKGTTQIDRSGNDVKRQETYLKLWHLYRQGRVGRVERSSLWKAYKLAKFADPNIGSRLPRPMWNLIWSMESIKTHDNPRRTLHLEELYRDMLSAGRPIKLVKRLEYVECLFLNSKNGEAFQEWKDVEERHGHAPQVLQLGAMLYSHAGNADKACKLMYKLFDRHPDWDPSIMLSVLRAHTSSSAQEHHDVAKEIYIKLRERKATKMTLEDYDTCLVGFLEGRHLPYAKQVFQDMIKDGCLGTTIADRDRVLERLHMLYLLAPDLEIRNEVALHIIELLPEDYHSHAFGDWMKLGVAEKEPQVVTQILDLMVEQGYNPDVYHFNMLLKALMRSKQTPDVLKAENIGWKMIEQARKVRYKSLIPTTNIRAKVEASQPRDRQSPKAFPPGNRETFAVIMRHHARKEQWEHVDYLQRQLKEAAIRPNTEIMNVLLDKKCRQGAYAEAWAIYKELTNQPTEFPADDVSPNGTSFRHLWLTLRLSLGDETRNDPGLPSPRELLRETVDWWKQHQARFDAAQFRQGLAASDLGAINPLILHCFGYTQDLVGSLVALHVLHQKLDIYPTAKVAAIIKRQAAWFGIQMQNTDNSTQLYHTRRYVRRARGSDELLRTMWQRRIQDIDQASLSQQQFNELFVNVLSEFLKAVLKRMHPPETVELMIDEAKKEVGVPEMSTGDLTVFEVP